MSLSTQPYKGARDFYPEDKRIQKYIFTKLRAVVESYGYQEYDAPIIEPTELYLSKTSDEIVNEQTYSFTDRGERNVTLRPEMTPTVSRMVAGKRQELAYPLRWYSIPDLWRYERPQAGRLRQHYQLNVDLFGVEGIEADIEVITIADSILKAFKAEDYYINIGSRKLLKKLEQVINLKQDQQKTFYRLADSKNKISESEFKQKMFEIGTDVALTFFFADKIKDLPTPLAESKEAKEVETVMNRLKEAGVNKVYFEPDTVRGFDYYTDIVFEVFDTSPENNRSMFGGGRYDGLVGLFGVDPVPTVGFGMGDVTLQRFLELHKLLPDLTTETDAVVIIIGDNNLEAQKTISDMRKAGANIAIDSSSRKIDAKIRSAVKSGVPFVLFIGDEELKSGEFKLRNLKRGEEHLLPVKQVVETLIARRR